MNYLSYFHEIDKIMIVKAAYLTKGAGGPSHLDTDQFHHMLLSKKFTKTANSCFSKNTSINFSQSKICWSTDYLLTNAVE